MTDPSDAPGTRSRFQLSCQRLAGLTFIFRWIAIGGTAHFVATDAEMRIVPPLIPWSHAAAQVALLVLIAWATIRAPSGKG